ncbi:Hemolysin, contains CBS domains [Actinopolymorpha cephalotaxi]|uniref:CBS domain containing-hemolysin-like protein n=1 Tax=Actinopolymorpha cephalotaxi TaxID=504797 RepID=A0A1I2WXX6_9ACTN|nr:hemolysin family protein [Actinopolymorpha cephalotaxi]NYH85162.1 CBS domain containing-hemolysin-like protein [Actinopolymorpha cephalotaxi]SFH05587.1 Hemolysin, contains CBS domains [Actinopolymorpha cephalotaxi]
MSELDPLLALVLSALIIVASAFFVAIEFALIAARRHRLEEAARTSVAARAALRSSRDLSLLLAGSQLGITVCLVALGAVTKPAVHHLLTPALETLGAPEVAADVAGFILALVVVTFLHLVVGEMAPKSWAISHPEKSAIMLALPMRAFMWLTRPALLTLNGLANWCLRRIGVEPVDEVPGGHGPEELRQLVDHSAAAGALDGERRHQLATALAVNTRPISEVVTPVGDLVEVGPETSGAAIRDTARETGHLRLLVRRAGEVVGVVHVRDALTRPHHPARDLMSAPVTRMPANTPIYKALTTMRVTRSHLALVEGTDGTLLGLVTLQDLVDELLTTHQDPAPPEPATTTV